MTCRIRLVLALHNHQPIGNFDGVFEAAYQDSYAPFLEVLEKYPDLPICLHTSGSLMEWLVERHPEYIDRVRQLTERGQLEIIGGPFYEPILAGIPRRDRQGQIAAYSRYLEKLFGAKVRGMWVPERVWEQSFAGDIAKAGIEYTILDDFHFRNAGLRDEELCGYYLTEDEGRLLKIFPGSEKLRYTIPFADPQETIDYLKRIADTYPNAVVTFGDDGEKFGTWPGTKKHVYQDGWIYRFFDSLRANADWLKVSTLAEVIDNVSPLGKVYLPDASYREMTEWALPVPRQVEYEELVHHHKHEADWGRLQQFIRGGFWRNFRVKYPEANEMYARMLQISERLESLSESPNGRERGDLLSQARTELYRAQCNCSYWHGAFGGLYLPHLRNAVYRHLIAADTLLEQAAGRDGTWVEVTAGDFNLDARKEIRLAGDRLVAFVAPGRGGHIFELDIRSISHNLLATLNRRAEVYHRKVREAGDRQGEHGGNHAVSIHDLVAFKQPDLHKKLQYDLWPRKSCVDHFFQPGLNLESAAAGEGRIGDFDSGVYETVLRRAPEHAAVRMRRSGQLGPYAITVVKTITLDVGSGSQLEIEYELESLPPQVPVHFGVEFNFAGMAAGASDRYFYDAQGRQLGQLQSQNDLQSTDRIGLVDEWLGLDASLELSQPGGIWTFPVQTISQSEGGFEAVHQSTCVIPHWEIVAPSDGRWKTRIVLNIDTSVAQARKLRETAEVVS
jgi:4-alpha-glucanotransferase